MTGVDGTIDEDETDDERSMILSRTLNEKINKQAMIARVAVKRHLLLCRDAYPTKSGSFEMDML